VIKLNSNNKNNNRSRELTLDERAFYMLQSIEGTQQIIHECWTRYKKDGNMSALKVAFDGCYAWGDIWIGSGIMFIRS
jgi:hypothetical protein